MSKSTTDVADPRLELLERYRAQLEALLAMFDGKEPPSVEAMGGAWQRCNATFSEFQVEQEAMADAPCPEEVRAAIKESMRLNAVAVSELVRHKAELFDQKGVLRRQQAVLDSQRTLPTKGRSCDLSG